MRPPRLADGGLVCCHCALQHCIAPTATWNSMMIATQTKLGQVAVQEPQNHYEINSHSLCVESERRETNFGRHLPESNYAFSSSTRGPRRHLAADRFGEKVFLIVESNKRARLRKKEALTFRHRDDVQNRLLSSQVFSGDRERFRVRHFMHTSC